MSENKPLRWSFLVTFSIVVCAIWAVVWTLAHVEQKRFVNELSRRIASAPENEAVVALRQTAQLREPPLEVLVLAAASPAREVAGAAQDSISDLLRKWQHESKSSRGAAQVAARLERLAGALDAEQEAITSLDLHWLESTAERMLRLADAAPPADALAFTDRCEALLLVARQRDLEPRLAVVPVANAMLNSVPVGLFAPPSRLALQSIVPSEQPLILDESDPPPTPPEFSSDAVPVPRPFRQPIDESLKSATPIPGAAVSDGDATPIDQAADVTSRDLLKRWLAASGAPQRDLAQELRRRGFGSLRSDVVRLALAGDTKARVQLVHELPTIPGVGAKAWLMLLAEDADAEVRLTAVSVMATSSDAELLDRAWNVALHDRDPRIAGIAERLRDRRSSSSHR